MTKEEIQSKLETIRKNNALPEKQKGMLIDKYEKMLSDMGEKPKPAFKKVKVTPMKDLDKKTKEDLEDYFQKSNQDAEDDEDKVLISYEDFKNMWNVTPHKEFLFWVGWDQYSYDEFKEMGGGDFKKGLEKFYKDSGYLVDFQVGGIDKTFRIDIRKSASTAPSAKKASVSRTSKAKPTASSKDDEYNCDDLEKEARERKAKALAAYEKRKNAPKKSATTKSKEAVVKAEKSVENAVKKGDISVAEIEKIIAEYEDAIKKLKALLEKSKTKMATGGSVDPEEVEHLLMKAQGIKEHHCKCNEKMAKGGGVGKRYESKLLSDVDEEWVDIINKILENPIFSNYKKIDTFYSEYDALFTLIQLANNHIVIVSWDGMSLTYSYDTHSSLSSYKKGKYDEEEDEEIDFETMEDDAPNSQERKMYFGDELSNDELDEFFSSASQNANDSKMAKGGGVYSTKEWEVIGINQFGKKFRHRILLGRMSDENDVKNAMRRRTDLNIREITSIKQVYAGGGGVGASYYALLGGSHPFSDSEMRAKVVVPLLGPDFETIMMFEGNYLNPKYDEFTAEYPDQITKNWKLVYLSDSHQGYAKISPDGKVIKASILSSFSIIGVFYVKSESKNKTKMATGGGISYNDALAEFNGELISHPMVIELAKNYNKTPQEVVKILQPRISTKGNRSGKTTEVSIDLVDRDSNIVVKHKKRFERGGRMEAGGVVGQEIVFDDNGEENTGVIKSIHENTGDYIVNTDDGRTVLVQLDRDVISLGKMRKNAPIEAPRKRFGLFDQGGSMGNE